MTATSPVVHARDALGASSASSARGVPSVRSLLAPRLAAAVLAALAVASLVYWGLRMTGVVTAGVHGNAANARLPEAADPDRVARLLAAPVARPAEGAVLPLSGRLQLVGVAAGVSGRGTALISVDGQAARPYPVGAVVAEGLVLQSVQGRKAQLGPAAKGPATTVLELPPLPSLPPLSR